MITGQLGTAMKCILTMMKTIKRVRGHKKSHKHHDGDDDGDKDKLKAVNNPIYKQDCGACHIAYQPELLPSDSWIEIMKNLGGHFGEAADLGDDSRKIISEYLKVNNAESSSAKQAVKIMRSLGNQRPLRITDIPYIQKKHHEISQKI